MSGNDFFPQNLFLNEYTGETHEVLLNCNNSSEYVPNISSANAVVAQENQILDEITGELREALTKDLINNNELNIRNEAVIVITRKRKRNTLNWKRNIRKKKHEAGEEYVSSRGKTVKARCVSTKKDCMNKCKFNCSRLVDECKRKDIFTAFYNMSTNEKYHYIHNTSEKSAKKRSTVTNNSRKVNSYVFYFPIDRNFVKVCKTFYLTTLSISQKMVYGVHDKKNVGTGTPNVDRRGKHGKHKKVAKEAKDIVRDHITSFPVIQSHYCRSSTKRNYLDPSLTISKMYDLYKEMCKEKVILPVKDSMYRGIFNEEFNLSFLVPKKDRCDMCSEFDMATKELSVNDDLKLRYESHKADKEAMRKERKADRESKQPVLCFDLENVLSCPKADVSCFFYKSKLNVYNLTAHFSEGKEVYCILWNEILSGRSGNDLASAVRLLLEKVYENNPSLNSLILWCDSCVPQNRNSMMSYAIMDFLKTHEEFKDIIIKYSTPGHSGIQEVDNVHSCIESVLRPCDYYSPVSLTKLIKNVRKNKPYHVIQMLTHDVKDFGECAKSLPYDKIPFTKVTAIKFTQCYFHIAYKTSHAGEWINTNILPPERPRRNRQGQVNVIRFPRDLPEPKILRLCKRGMPQHKVDCIKSMYKWMPLSDKQYYQALFREIGM